MTLESLNFELLSAAPPLKETTSKSPPASEKTCSGWTMIRLFFCPPPFQPSQCWEQIVGVMLLRSMLAINYVVLYCCISKSSPATQNVLSSAHSPTTKLRTFIALVHCVKLAEIGRNNTYFIYCLPTHILLLSAIQLS